MNDSREQAETFSGHRLLHAISGKYLDEYLETALAQRNGSREPLAYVAIQVMQFTATTAAFGVAARDELLVTMAAALRSILPADAKLFHVQTDVFGVVLLKTSYDKTPQFVQSISDLFRQPFVINSIPIYAEVSIGVAVYPHHARASQPLRQAAAAALTEAQRQFQPFCIYDPRLHKRHRDGLALVSELRGALEQDQTELWYQPKISLSDGAPIGAEALLRWRHPTRGLLTPDFFIEPAERTGIITDVTKWVLKTAAEHLTYLEDDRVRVSVNLSAKNILEPGLEDMVRHLLQYYQIPPERIEIEITESALVRNPIRAARVLKDLREVGVSIAIDDFGAGYASLRYLSDFPITAVKIDQRFAAAVLNDSRCAIIVDGIIGLCHRLGLQVVAEGVENGETVSWLIGHHCDAIQGYFVSKPMPHPEYVKWSAEIKQKGGFPLRPFQAGANLRLI